MSEEYNALVNCYHCKKEHLANYKSPPPEGWFKVQYGDDTYGLYCSVSCFISHSEGRLNDNITINVDRY